MRVRYQQGYLRVGRRKKGPDCWEFLWWDREPTGMRIRRKAVIGTHQQYPNVEDSWQASNGLRLSINENRKCQREQVITVADFIGHYSTSELAGDPIDGGKSHATKTVCREFPRMGEVHMWESEAIRACYSDGIELNDAAVTKSLPSHRHIDTFGRSKVIRDTQSAISSTNPGEALYQAFCWNCSISA